MYQKAIQMFKAILGDPPDDRRKPFTFTPYIYSCNMLTFTIPFVIVYIYSQTSFINISKYIIWCHPFESLFLYYIHYSNSVQHFKTQYLRWLNLSRSTVLYTRGDPEKETGIVVVSFLLYIMMNLTFLQIRLHLCP